jgi:serine protease Do
METKPMLPNSPSSGKRSFVSPRSRFLGSVAALGIAALVAGSAYEHALPGISGLAAPAYAAEVQTQEPAGFADLVARVKPAVISVRVKMDASEQQASLNDNNNRQNGQSRNRQNGQGSPMERFFRQFGFNDRNGRNFGFDDQQFGGRQFGQGQNTPAEPHRMVTGLGSGFFITADGYAVTNNHVVDHATAVQVTTDDGSIYTAKVVGTDPTTDLALIKVDGKNDFPHVQFADHAPRIGDWVVAVGNPFGLGGTVTAGIVSASGRDIGSGPYDYIQIDAPIN